MNDVYDWQDALLISKRGIIIRRKKENSKTIEC